MGKQIAGRIVRTKRYWYGNEQRGEYTVRMDNFDDSEFESIPFGASVILTSRSSSETEESPANVQCCGEESDWNEVERVMKVAWKIGGDRRAFFSLWCSDYDDGEGTWFAGHNDSRRYGHVVHQGKTPLEAAERLLAAVKREKEADEKRVGIVEPVRDNWTEEECLEWLSNHEGRVECYEDGGGSHRVLLVKGDIATTAFSWASKRCALQYLVERVHARTEAE